MIRVALFRLALLSSLGLAACTVETAGPPPPPADGTVTLAWTINGTTDPGQCAQGSVSTLDVTVTTVDGAFVGEFQAACESFATTIHLAPGRYGGHALLLDPNGAARTTAIDLVPYTVAGGTNLNLPIDFPASSFHPPT